MPSETPAPVRGRHLEALRAVAASRGGLRPDAYPSTPLSGLMRKARPGVPGAGSSRWRRRGCSVRPYIRVSALLFRRSVPSRSLTATSAGMVNRSLIDGSLARGRLAVLEALGPRLGLAWIRPVGKQTLHALVEVLRRNGLCFAGREFACHLGLRFVAQGTGLRGGISLIWAVPGQDPNSERDLQPCPATCGRPRPSTTTPPAWLKKSPASATCAASPR